MGIAIGGLELYAGPTALGAPDDLQQVIVDFIDEARHSIGVAVQEIDSRPIAEAVLAAKRRGVRVRVILEGDYLVDAPGRGDAWASGGSHEENRLIVAAFLRSGIDVISDLNRAIFHQKFVVRDVDKPTAAVLTGSTNFTLTDTGAHPTENNLNHVVVLHGRTVAGLYQDEFDRLRQGTFGDLHERVEPRPREFRLGRMRVKPLFAPRHGPEMEIMKQMLKARSRIDFAMFTFAQSSGIDDTMFRLAETSTRIRGVLDRMQGAQTWSATRPLKQAGVELHANRPGIGVRLVHHKLMVIDEQLTIVGSFNYTSDATTLNDENIIVLGDLEETAPSAQQAQRTLARFALDEIDRIVDDLADPV